MPKYKEQLEEFEGYARASRQAEVVIEYMPRRVHQARAGVHRVVLRPSRGIDGRKTLERSSLARRFAVGWTRVALAHPSCCTFRSATADPATQRALARELAHRTCRRTKADSRR